MYKRQQKKKVNINDYISVEYNGYETAGTAYVDFDETGFSEAVIKAQGKNAYNGLKMLLYQGVSAYELWNDCKITKEEADEVYKCLQKELGIDE